MDISIRPLTVRDEPVLWDFLYLAVHVPPGQPPYPRDILKIPEIRRYVQGWGRLHDGGFIAHDHLLPVGAVWIRLLTGSEKGFGYVDNETPELAMSVHADYRGQGIGSRLLTAVLDKASSHHHAVSLSVDDSNDAKRLYDRFGFVVVGKTGSSWIMMKRLVPQK